MNRSLTLAAAIFFLLLLAVSFWRFGQVTPDRENLAAPSTTADVQEDAESPNSSSARRALVLEKDLAEAAASQASIDDEVLEDNEVWLQFIEEDTQRAVPYAEVYLPAEAHLQLGRQHQLLPRLECYREFVKPRIADELGRLRLSPIPHHLWAFKDKLVASSYGERESQGLTIVEMRERRFVEVQVLGVDQKPRKSIAVALRTRSLRSESVQTWTVVETDESGCARVPLETTEQTLRLLPYGYQLFVAIESVHDAPIEAAINLNSPPEEKVILRLPASGSLRISIGPERVSSEVAVVVSIAGSGSPFVARLVTPELIISGLPLGERLQVSLRGETTSPHLYPAPVTCMGPMRENEVVSINLDSSNRVAQRRIQGRLLDSSGQPIPWTSVSFRGPTGSYPEYGFSDLDGRFIAGVGLGLVGGLQESDLTIVLRSQQYSTATLSRQKLGEGLTNLGDLRFALPPLIARGRVTDQENNPIVAFFRLGSRDSEGHFVELDREANDLANSCSRLGEFSIRGRCEDQPLSLTALAEGYETQTFAIERGQVDLEIKLEKTQDLDESLKSRVLLLCQSHKGRSLSSLFLVGKLRRGQGKPGESASIPVLNGRAEARLLPGVWDSKLQPVGSFDTQPPAIKEWSALTLEPGATTDLGTLEVEPFGLDIRVQVVGEDGLVLPEGWWQLRTQVKDGTSCMGRWESGSEIKIDTLAERLPLWLTLNLVSLGQRKYKIEEAETEITIGLAKRLSLKLKNAPGLSPGTLIRFKLKATSLASIEGRFVVGQEESVDVTVPRPGRYWIFLACESAFATFHDYESPGFGYSPRSVDISWEDERPAFEIELSKNFLECAAEFGR